MTIKKIIIRGGSGWGSVDEAYEDKLTLTSKSIAYEYKPHPMSNSETNVYRKWAHRTTSPSFAAGYQEVAEMAPSFLHNDDELFAADIGSTEITAIFDDGHKETVSYFCPGEFFREWFLVIKKLVPETECTPAVIKTGEGCKSDEAKTEQSDDR